MYISKTNTRLCEDIGINSMGQKDLEKLYWERDYRDTSRQYVHWKHM